MNEANSYTALDIERYHNGELPPAEMHAMEKAAMDDPFLSDALEGYAFTKTGADDLQSLQQKLAERISKSKTKKIFSIGNSWMKIAALFILIAGGGWLVFQTLSTTTQEKALAVNKDKQNAPVENPTYKIPDSITSPLSSQNNEDMVFRSDKETKQNTTKKQSAPALITPPEQNMKDEEKKEVAASKIAEEKRSLTPTAVQPLKDNSLAEVVITKEANKATVRGVTTSDTIKNFDMVMQNAEMDPKDVVVLNKGKAKSSMRRDKVVIDTLEPEQGWNNFDDYIASNLKPPDELKLKSISGEVELSFEVNKEGEPVNITIIKSLCQKCDEEAIRLLKDGPKWNKKKTKGKVKIKF